MPEYIRSAYASSIKPDLPQETDVASNDGVQNGRALKDEDEMTLKPGITLCTDLKRGLLPSHKLRKKPMVTGIMVTIRMFMNIPTASTSTL